MQERALLVILSAGLLSAQTQITAPQISATNSGTLTRVNLEQAHRLCAARQAAIEIVNRTSFKIEGSWVTTGYAVLVPRVQCHATTEKLVVQRSIYSGGSLRFEFPDFTDPNDTTAVVVVLLNIPTPAGTSTTRYLSSSEYRTEPGVITLIPHDPIPLGAGILIEYKSP